jgi:transaldolase
MRVIPLSELHVKIFLDGGSLSVMESVRENPLVRGFTTNPTLLQQSAVTSYGDFARRAVAIASDKPISFEVLADDWTGMERQARKIASWGKNVYVKIPVTNSLGESSCPLAHFLSHSGVQVNVTAVLTSKQVFDAFKTLEGGAPACISIFAGRIADTGRDPQPIFRAATALLLENRSSNVEIIWASAREVLNIYQADDSGCDIITLSESLFRKLPLLGKDLAAYSRETVQQFLSDGASAGLRL